MANHLLAIGINYTGSQNALRGCINDAKSWSEFFAPDCSSNRQLLEQSATKAGIVHEIATLMAMLKPGDCGIVTYSGHGTYLPDQSGDETDGRDEALCPFDLTRNLLLDDELHDLLGNRADGSRVLLITDCCHSGTMTRAARAGHDSELLSEPIDRQARYVDFAALSTCMCESTIGRIYSQARAARALPKSDKAGLTHWAGCKDTEVSYDATIDGKACGAFTNAALKILRKGAQGLTTAWLQAAMTKVLPSQYYPQTPQFDGDLAAVVPGFEVAATTPGNPPLPAQGEVGTLAIGGKVYDVTLRK